MSYSLKALPKELTDLHGYGILTDLDIYLAETLNRRFAEGKADDTALLACCLAGRVVSQSHVCLDKEILTPDWLVALGQDDSLTAALLPSGITDLCGRLAEADAESLIESGNGLIGTPDSPAPIAVAGNRIYLRRYWRYEALTAQRLMEMSGMADPLGSETEISEQLDDMKLEGKQRDAALEAMNRKLTVISGGPGTGKTYAAARILEMLIRLSANDGTPPVIRMAAPTGKAAARLDESVREAIKDIGEQEHHAYIENACTIDRLLGFKPNSPYFKYDQQNPLRAEALLIDEASMIDLPKMAKLLDAIGDNCRVVLLGDMHQLASVAPGSVMADICQSTKLADCVIELTESRRFTEGSPVHQLGIAVNQAEPGKGGADAWALLQTLNADEFDEKKITLTPVPQFLSDHGGLAVPELAEAVIDGYSSFMEADTPKAAFKALSEFRILCALRRGPQGIWMMNRLVEDILSGQAVKKDDLPEKLRGWKHLKPTGEFYKHRVIMVTQNDYPTGLFNGNVGIVMPEEPNSDRLVTWFEGSKKGEALHKVPCRLLPRHETAFASTIHKSQGSEFGRVMVMLPYYGSPILTKELVYTAITRTKGGVDLWCNQNVFESAVESRVYRSSGLLQQLDG